MMLFILASEWIRRVTKWKEMVNSPTREGFVDLPLDSAAWLVHFKSQNIRLLKELDVCFRFILKCVIYN